MPERDQRICIYCDRPVGRVKKGEHIVQEAIGGSLATKRVCSVCNGAFSAIDTELCSRSPLSIVASQVMDAHLWQIWDVDHAAKHLLLEAWPDWARKSLTLYPQIVFERAGPQVRGDYEETQRFGQRAFEQVLIKAALRAFRHAEAGEARWLHFERVDAAGTSGRGYRLPPRIFVRHSIAELAERLSRNKRASFVLRFHNDADRRFALNALDNWQCGRQLDRFEVGIGSSLPAMRCFYDRGKTLRALGKIAVNLLAHCCPQTPVNPRNFSDVMRAIKGDEELRPQLFRSSGFVHAEDVTAIAAENDGHSFRLVYIDGLWHVYSSFFGGRVGSVVRFHGPNHEPWCCADVIAPLKSADWHVDTGRLLRPLSVHIEWRDITKIAPSTGIVNVSTELKVVRTSR